MVALCLIITPNATERSDRGAELLRGGPELPCHHCRLMDVTGGGSKTPVVSHHMLFVFVERGNPMLMMVDKACPDTSMFAHLHPD